MPPPPPQPRNNEQRMRKPTLHKRPKHLTPRLQQRMPHHDLQEPLQPLPPMLNHLIAEPIRKHLAGQRRDGHAGALALEDVAEILEIGVAAAHDGVAQLEGGDVGAGVDFVRGVHGALGGAVGFRVFDLWVRRVVNLVRVGGREGREV